MTGIIIGVCVGIFIFALIEAINSPIHPEFPQMLPIPEGTTQTVTVDEEQEPVEDVPKPDVSEPVISLINSMLNCDDEWDMYENYIPSSGGATNCYTYMHKSSKLTVSLVFSNYSGSCGSYCLDDWITLDEKIALIKAHQELQDRARQVELEEFEAEKQRQRAEYSSVFMKGTEQ